MSEIINVNRTRVLKTKHGEEVVSLTLFGCRVLVDDPTGLLSSSTLDRRAKMAAKLLDDMWRSHA